MSRSTVKFTILPAILPTMKIFQSVQTYFAQLGIEPQSQFGRKFPFELENVVIIVFTSVTFLLCCLFISIEASNFKEYSNCAFSIVTFFMGTFDFAIHVWKMEELFQFIKKLEHFIQKSKYFLKRKEFFGFEKLSIFIYRYLGLAKPTSREMYEKSNAKIEKWSKIVHSAMMIVTLPCIMVSILVAGYVMYFITDAGVEAFQLLSFAWSAYSKSLC